MAKILRFSKVFFLIPFILIFFSCATISQKDYYVPGIDSPAELNDSDTIKIVQISDLHSNDYGENQEKLVNAVVSAEPDVVFLTGDIFEFSWKLEKTLKNVQNLLAALQNICPFYYISGNHEYYKGHDNEYAYLIEEYGGIVLENQVEEIEIKGLNLIIAGVSDPISTLDFEDRKTDSLDLETYKRTLAMVAETAKSKNGDLYILLAHRPEYIEEYKAPGVYDLILSGHAHGGQWILPFANGLYAPGQGIFPKYAGGRYDFETADSKPTVFIISRGLSYQKPLFPRFGNPVEVVDILVQTEAFRK